jgi:hypothetical protein
MNADIPYIHCWVDRLDIAGVPGAEEAYAFAIQSMRGRALGVHVMLKSGAHYRNVPLHAITLHRVTDRRSASDLAYWDCFSSKPIVTVFDYLRDHECTALLPTGSKESGVYLFTVDWLPDEAQRPGYILEPDQNKCGHVLALHSGHLAMLPTNKIVWRDGYWIGNEPHPELMGYKVQSKVYQAENCDRDFSKNEAYFY